MKLRYFRNILNKTIRYAGSTSPKVMFCVDNKEYHIKHIGQFGVIPDVVIELEVENEKD